MPWYIHPGPETRALSDCLYVALDSVSSLDPLNHSSEAISLSPVNGSRYFSQTYSSFRNNDKGCKSNALGWEDSGPFYF